MTKILICSLTVCGILLLGFGCGKKPEAKPAEDGAATNAVESASTTPVSAPVRPTIVPPAEADPTAMLDALTQALRNYSASQRRVPASFNEIVAAGYIKNPPAPPAGKKFAIDTAKVRVVLVNQ